MIIYKVIEHLNFCYRVIFQSDRALQENNEKCWIQLLYDDDSDLYFTPEKNNVIFASAVDGFGGSI